MRPGGDNPKEQAMITDAFSTFFDSVPSAATATSPTLNLMSYFSRNEVVNLTFLASGPSTAATFTIAVHESPDGTTFNKVSEHYLKKPNTAAGLLTIRLAPDIKGPFVRVSYSGGATGMTIFAGITRDQVAMYENGMYIDKGKVVK